MYRYFSVYKPYQVLAQFSRSGEKKTLSDIFNLPHDVYPLGRLDYDSEGLLLLTNDPSVNKRLLNPLQKHEREYYVQVEGSITTGALKNLRKGVRLQIDGKIFITAPAQAAAIPEPRSLPPRNPPIRFRREIPVSWIKLVLTEGKNRQVRRMTAKVGFPTLRLVRYRIGKITIDGMMPGDLCEYSGDNWNASLFS